MRTVQFALLLVALFTLGSVVSIPMAHAPPPTIRTWTGLAGDGKWETPGNWDCNCVPGPADAVVIRNPPGNFVVTVSTTQTVDSIAVDITNTLVCQSTCVLTATTSYDSTGTFKNFGTFTVGSLEVGAVATFLNFGTVIITTTDEFSFDNAGTFINECHGTVNETPTMGSGTFTTVVCPVGGEVLSLDYGSLAFSAVPWILIIAAIAAAGAIVIRQKSRLLL